jgi:phosphoenolpyruvate carboxykinase (ATP)
VYAELLGERLDSHGSAVWLVNTGWTGGPYGQGERMPIAATRAMLHAALSGRLDAAPFRTDDVFGFEVPEKVPGVDARLLDPRSTWRDPEAYDEQAEKLARMFVENFTKFGDEVAPDVAAAAPRS